MSPEYFDSAVGNDRNVTRALDCIENRGELRNSDACHDARRADRAGPDANLHRIDAALDKRRRTFARCNVARDELNVRERLARICRRFQHTLAVTVRSVDHEHVDAGIDERPRAIAEIHRSNRGGHHQPAVLILVRVRELAPLMNVAHRDQAP